MYVRPIIAGLGLLAFIVPVVPVSARAVVHPAASRAAAPAAACTSTGYTSNCGGCVKVSASRSYTVTVPHTSLKLKGTKAASGATVCFAKVATPVPSKGGIGVRVTATRSLGSVKLTGAKHKVYLFHPATKTLTTVKVITKVGIYQIV
jgi:hypothetical protein